MCTTADEIFVGAWTDAREARPDINANLVASRDSLMKSIGATLLTTSGITYQGLPGIEYTGNWQPRASLVTGRTLMDGKRLYQYAIVTPLNQNRAATIGRFLTSVHIARSP
jgi:phage gpG-like protein